MKAYINAVLVSKLFKIIFWRAFLMTNKRAYSCITITLTFLLCSFFVFSNRVSAQDWEWQNPLPQGNTLKAVWGNSSNDVFAVGYYGTIVHYDGSSWSVMDNDSSEELLGVWGSSEDDVFAVGTNGTILHYDGVSWAPMARATTNHLWGVWGSSSNDVYAVGNWGTILHYDGNTWTPMNSGTDVYLSSIWGSAGNDIYAVGDRGTILHYNGVSWTPSPSNALTTLTSIWGSSSSNIYVASRAGVLLHYNGSQWSQISTSSFSNFIHIWGSPDGKVYIAAANHTIYSYDGNQQGSVNIAYTTTGSLIYGIWGSSATNVFAIGEWGEILRFGGASWVKMNSVPTKEMRRVWGSPEDDVFAVGVAGTILRYDGVTWNAMPNPLAGNSSYTISGIWGTSGRNVYAVGSQGKILHYNGSIWTERISPTTYDLYSLWGASETDIFATGASGTILHFDGSTWSRMSTGTSGYFYGIWGTSGSDVYASGPNGQIFHYDGSSWSSMNSCTTQNLLSLWGNSGNDIFAVGDNGTILHYNGTIWSTMVSGTSRNLRGIWGSSDDDVYAVGSYGTILHYDGFSWSRMSTKTENGLDDVWGSSGSNVFVAGGSYIKYGTILHHSGPIVSDFSASPRYGLPPLSVIFTDRSTGAIESWLWDFGDGTTSTTRNPSHTYTDLGTYNVKLTISGPEGTDTRTKAAFISVFNYVLSCSSQSLDSSCNQGRSPADQSFQLWNSGTGSFNYTISTDQPWLSCTPSAETLTGVHRTITVKYSTASLEPGSHSANIIISAPGATNAPRAIPVTLTVDAAKGGLPFISLDAPGSYTLSCARVSNPSSRSFNIWNSGGGELNYSASSNVTWITCIPSNGSSSGEKNTVTLQFSTSSLSPGSYSAAITITSTNASNDSQVIPVHLTVASLPGEQVILLTPASLTASCTKGTDAADQMLWVSNSSEKAFNYSISSLADWISFTPTEGTVSGNNITVHFKTSELEVGEYEAAIAVISTDETITNSPQTVLVHLTVEESKAIEAEDSGGGGSDEKFYEKYCFISASEMHDSSAQGALFPLIAGILAISIARIFRFIK